MAEQEKSRMLISSMYREFPGPEGLPRLIDDARQNPLTTVEGPEGTNVYVKSVAMPYVERHVLVLPDSADRTDLPGVNSVPDGLLTTTLSTAAKAAEYYVANPEVSMVDIGYNFSQQEPLKIVASQRNNLHVHVEGITEADRAHRITMDQIRERPADFKTTAREPLAPVINNVMETQVFGNLMQDPAVSQFFERVERPDGRITFRLTQGLASLNQEAFAVALKRIHARGQEAYNEIARCFLATNEQGNFVEGQPLIEGQPGRYQLLPREQRVEQVQQYISNHDDLSPLSQQYLRRLAETAREPEAIIADYERRNGQPLGEDERRTVLRRFSAIRNFAYATVISGVKDRATGQVDWLFGFDPVVFSQRDISQASRGETKMFERDTTQAYPPEKLARVQADEARLKAHLEAA